MTISVKLGIRVRVPGLVVDYFMWKESCMPHEIWARKGPLRSRRGADHADFLDSFPLLK